MDLGLLVFLLVLGSVIFDSRKKKRSRNEDQQNPSDSMDSTSTEREPYDWSEPSKQSRPGPKATTSPKKSKEAMSWEAMEEYYGIKMERKERPNETSQDRASNEQAKASEVITVLTTERSSDGRQASGHVDDSQASGRFDESQSSGRADGRQRQSGSTSILIKTPKEDRKVVNTGRETSVRNVSLASVATAKSSVSQAKTVQSMPSGGTWEPAQVAAKGKRAPALPPGGLKAGIVWSLILQPPKAKQQGAYRR